MIAPEVLAAYDASREPGADRSVLCHAPFVSLNFDQSGRVTACCYNREFVLGRYPEQSVREIWSGEGARALREAFRTGGEARGCDLCFHQLKNRNFSGVLMRQFDAYSQPKGGGAGDAALERPALLEFEISNTCSLECVMCGGHWSSTIRARREKLPPLRSPYDRAFVDQLEEFLPSIRAAKFLGGEPFLIERYYDIWERLSRVNPEAQLWITTSAAVVPERGKALLERLRAHIVISLDSLTPDVYESIRQNARFDVVMANLEYFRAYAARRGTSVSIAVCPMTKNWRELRTLVEFCEAGGMGIYFNTVTRPADLSLAGLTLAELTDVVETFERDGQSAGAWSTHNQRQWDGMANLVRGWLGDKRAFAGRVEHVVSAARAFVAAQLSSDDGVAALDIEPLAAAWLTERERASADEFQNLILPRPPLPGWEGDRPPSAGVLLGAAHLLSTIADPKASASGSTELRADLRRLARFAEDPADPATSHELAAQFCESVTGAHVTALVKLARLLLSLRTDEITLARAARELEARLACAWNDWVATAPALEVQERVARYVNSLVSAWLPARLAATTRVDVPGHAPPTEAQTLHTFDDLVASIDAASVFHRFVASDAEQPPFARKAEVVRQAVARSGSTYTLLAALPQISAGWTYRFLSDSTDEQIAGALAHLA